MGHGGTNFGFWSGANGGGGSSFQPHETSYDYDSPVSEAGEHGFHAGVDKFAAMKAVLAKHFRGTVPPEPALPPRRAFGNVTLGERVPLLSALAALAPAPVATEVESTPAMGSGGRFLFFYIKTLEARVCLRGKQTAPWASQRAALSFPRPASLAPPAGNDGPRVAAHHGKRVLSVRLHAVPCSRAAGQSIPWT